MRCLAELTTSSFLDSGFRDAGRTVPSSTGGDGGRLVATTRDPVDPDTLEGIRALASAGSLALDRIELAEQLHRQRTDARFQTLVQHSSDAILVVDATGRIEYASPSTNHVLSERGNLEQRLFVDLVSSGDRPRIPQVLLGGSADTSTQTLEFTLASALGDLEVEAACTNLLANEDIRGIVFNIRNISERKQFERELATRRSTTAHRAGQPGAVPGPRRPRARACSPRRRPLAVLFLDLDDFKAVNDTLGHHVGDQLIRTIAERIAKNTRSIDTAARLGGDEFAVFVDDDRDVDHVKVAERLLAVASAIPS